MSLEHVQLFEDFVQTLQDAEAISEKKEVNEEHLEDRKDQEAFIIKNSDKTADDLKDLSDGEVKKLYSGLEESVKEAEEAEEAAKLEEAKKVEEEEAKKKEEEEEEEEEGGEESAKDKMAKVRAAKKD